MIARYIAASLARHRERLRGEFSEAGRIPSCHLDDLLPDDLAREIHDQFPSPERMTFKNTLRERKYVSAQMNNHASIIEEVVYAFQDDAVLALIKEIAQLNAIEGDANLYAGGISSMVVGNYLRPHIDNSHDKDQARYRVLNLLYYVTPDWEHEYGGNLELWDRGLRQLPREIVSRFNRLVIMGTNRESWHSVSEVRHGRARCCVSNYYFSSFSLERENYFHATSFRGRPEEPVIDKFLRADNSVRTTLLKIFGSKIFKNPHVYQRLENSE